MFVFILCLFCAGVTLSVFARFPLLVLVALLAAIATSLSVVFGAIDKDLIGSTLVAFLLPIVALQVGYGAGVVAITWIHGAFRSRRPINPSQRVVNPSSKKGRTRIDSSPSV